MKSKARQTILGKAFEYACAVALQKATESQAVVLEDTSQLRKAQGYYEDELTDKEREKFDKAAAAGVRILLRFEPQVLNPFDNVPLILTLVSDEEGQAGDVRDVLCLRKQNEWEIGISCKHNHSAVKHSRLSATLNFGQKWFGIPCSDAYFKEIAPIFANLADIRKQSNKTAKWNVLGGSDAMFTLYKSVLDAFIRELKRLDKENPGVIASRLVSYLIGVNDFYKFITMDVNKATQIQAFNMYGTLNRAAGRTKAIAPIRRLKLPTCFHKIDYLEVDGIPRHNTVALYCNNGWEISMRIHNASSRVEPSLKFDVQLMTYPKEITSVIEPWNFY